MPKLIDYISEFFIKSTGFNGIPISILLTQTKESWDNVSKDLKNLILNQEIGIIDSKTDINPNIIRLGFEPKEEQIKKLESDKPNDLCIYPTKKVLINLVDKSMETKTPYTYCLATGEAQLATKSFDLSVLEFYRNDPRYEYTSDDISGTISYTEKSPLYERDKTFLQTFGFCYDEEYNRGVVVYLRYLTDLTPEHQAIWKAKELNDDFKMHPDYYKSTILGEFRDYETICTAFLVEIYVINQMTKSMGRPQLFRKDFGKCAENRPKKFGFLLRPTLGEFNDFVLLFDKLLSDNINKSFFLRDVPIDKKIQREDGSSETTQKGTLQILDDWVRTKFKTIDWKLWDESIAAFRKLRKLRQKPAHAIDEDIFDQKYFKEQRKILIKVYAGLRTLRLMFANHPSVMRNKINVPDWLFEGKIWTK